MSWVNAQTFDDISIVPQYSDIQSRSDCKLNTKLGNIELDIPLIASPMDTVCGPKMALALGKLGGLGIIHRFDLIGNQLQHLLELEDIGINYGIAVGVKDNDRIDQLLSWTNANLLCIDVAHGHHSLVKNTIKYIKDIDEDLHVMAGNVCTSEGADDLQSWGANSLRVGIGNGSMCETRIRAGVGVPQVDTLRNVTEIDIPIISDGGCKTTGDVAKALALGSDAVMIGSLFSGTKETPGTINKSGMWPNEQLYKKYQGSASVDSKLSRGEESKNVEGNSKITPYKGKVSRIVNDINDGVRSAMSYVGARTLEEFREKVTFVSVSQAGQIEAQPHGLI